jgi:hypothetical protein
LRVKREGQRNQSYARNERQRKPDGEAHTFMVTAPRAFA